MTDQNQLLREALQDIEQAHDLSLDLDHYASRQVLVSLADKIKVALAQSACTMGELCPGCPPDQQIKCLAADASAAADETSAKLASNYHKLVQDLEDPTYRAKLAAEWGYVAAQPAEGGEEVPTWWMRETDEGVEWTDTAPLVLSGWTPFYKHPPASQPAEGGEVVDYKALYEDAMRASNEAGFVDLDAAATIRALSELTTPPASQEQADTVKFSGIDDTLEMGRVRRLLEAQGIHMGSQFIAQLVEAASPSQAQQPSAKCDGNHGGPRCADPECWNDSPEQAAKGEVPEDCDVRKILLDIVPGDGNGLEVFAKNVGEVVDKLTELAVRLDEAEIKLAARPAHVVNKTFTLPGNHYGGVALWLGNEQVVLFITEPEARGASDIKAMLEGYTKRAVFEMTRDTQG